MTQTEQQTREEMTHLCRSLFTRGFSVGTAGNVSVQVEDGLLMSPTNTRLNELEPDRIAKIDHDGQHISGDKPSKEQFLHQAFYQTRASCGAVVHLHSTWATALSCASDTDPEDCIPAITPYVVMRVGRVKMVPYVKPGDKRAGELIHQLNGQCAAVLLANHGPVVSGRDLRSAVNAAEELEETAKLVMALKDRPVRHLTADQLEELNVTFGAP